MSAKEQLNEMKVFRQLMEDIENDNVCEQCGRAGCKCKPGTCKCKPVNEGQERPYVCYHAKKGEHECSADSSYGAAKKAAEAWGLNSTAGIDTKLTDITHSTQFVGEDADDLESDIGFAGIDKKLSENCKTCRGWDMDDQRKCPNCYGDGLRDCSYCDDEEPLDGVPCLNCGSLQYVGEDAGHSIRDILDDEEFTALLRDLDKEGDVVYGTSYFNKLYDHFLTTHADEIPIGHRTGRPDNVDEYVLDNLERDYGPELKAAIETELRSRRLGEDENDARGKMCSVCSGGRREGYDNDCPNCDGEGYVAEDDADSMGSYDISWNGDTWKEAIPYDVAEKEVKRILQIIDDSALQAHDNNDHLKVKKTADGDTMIWTVLDPSDGDYQEIRVEPSDMPAGYTGESIEEGLDTEYQSRWPSLNSMLGYYAEQAQDSHRQYKKTNKDPKRMPNEGADYFVNEYKRVLSLVQSIDSRDYETAARIYDTWSDAPSEDDTPFGKMLMSAADEETLSQIRHAVEILVRNGSTVAAQHANWMNESISLDSIVENVLQEYPGQPKDYDASDEFKDDYADEMNDIAGDYDPYDEADQREMADDMGEIDPEYEDSELGLRFD